MKQEVKRMIFGVLLFTIGFISFIGLWIYASANPWDYNGITGLYGSLLGTGTLLPFVITGVIAVVGIIICIYECYVRK